MHRKLKTENYGTDCGGDEQPTNPATPGLVVAVYTPQGQLAHR
jgi:hypothetical protein